MAEDLEVILREQHLQLQERLRSWLIERGFEPAKRPAVDSDGDDAHTKANSAEIIQVPMLSSTLSKTHSKPLDPPARLVEDPKEPCNLIAITTSAKTSETSEQGEFTPVGVPLFSRSGNQLLGTKPGDSSELPSWMRRRVSNASQASRDVVKRFSSQGTDVTEFLSQQKRLEALNHRSRLQKVTQSKAFEWTCLGLIITNSTFLAYQAQSRADFSIKAAAGGGSMDYLEDDAIVVLEVLFCFAFFVELVMRWGADGLCGFFFTRERSWNIVDIVIVGFSFLELAVRVAEATSLAAFKPSTLRLVRSVRVVRVLKVIRVVRFFRELRLMLYAILRCASLLFWVLMILFLMLFIFGISLTMGVVDELSTVEMWNEEGNKDLVMCFGSLDRAMLSLFQAAFGGRSWGEFYRAIQALPWIYSLIFLLYVVFSILAVVNVITGIFVDSALQCNQNDREMIVNEEMEQKRLFESRVRRVFEEMDDSGQGQLSLEDFEIGLDDDRVTAYLQALKLDVGDAKKLFMLLDYDGSGSVDLSEFLRGCDKLKGESKAFDQAVMQLEIKHLAQHMTRFQNSVEGSLVDLRRKLHA